MEDVEIEFKGKTYKLTHDAYYEIGQAWYDLKAAISTGESGTHAILNAVAAKHGVRLNTYVDVMEFCREAY